MRLAMSVSVAAISLTFLQFCVCGHVTAASASGCHGGQEEGDKWFDGCRWCVCENSEAVCSSSACSELNALLPACQDLGERWWDGCYRCTCLLNSIECTADRTCVELIKSQQFLTPAAYILSHGACIKPRDNRCVCGVDGVPSCTADAIDRNSLEATTIQIVSPYRRRKLPRMRPRPPSPPPPPSPMTTLATPSEPELVAPSEQEIARVLAHMRSFRPRPRNWRRPRPRRSAILPFARGLSSGKGKPIVRLASVGNAKTKRDSNKQVVKRRQIRSAPPTIPTLTGDSHKTPSLLVSTDNRCRWGSRWYGGGLRCYCDRKGAITCGDPQFVASRIDGFQMERIPCSEGDEWEEPRNCRYCECHVSGIALCWRAEYCPYPFVIAPVIPTDDDEDDSLADDTDSQNRNQLSSDLVPNVDEDLSENNGGLRTLDPSPRRVVQDPSTEDDTPGSGDDANGTLVPTDLPSQHRPVRPPPRSPAIGTGTVIVRECKPGRRWRDGCKRCSCNSNWEVECTDRFCLRAQAQRRPRPPASSGGSSVEMFRGRLIQRLPEEWSSRRDHPLPPIRPPPVTSCGPHALGEIYLEDCNECICRSVGPACTAMAC